MRRFHTTFACTALTAAFAVAGSALAQQSGTAGTSDGSSFDSQRSNQPSTQGERDQSDRREFQNNRMQQDRFEDNQTQDRQFRENQSQESQRGSLGRGQDFQDDRQGQIQQRERWDSQRQTDRMGQDRQQGDSAPAGLGVSVVDGNRGVRVQRVAPDSPAQQAGIRVGDEILTVNDRQIRDGQQLVDIVRQEDPGTSIDLEVVRNGRVQIVSADLERRGEVFSDQQMMQRRGYRSDSLDSPPWGDDELRHHIEALEQSVAEMQREIRDLRAMLDSDPAGGSYTSSQSESWQDEQRGTSRTQGSRNDFQRGDSQRFDQRSSRNFDSGRTDSYDANRSQNFDQNRSQNFDQDRSRTSSQNRTQQFDQDRSQRDRETMNRDSGNRDDR